MTRMRLPSHVLLCACLGWACVFVWLFANLMMTLGSMRQQWQAFEQLTFVSAFYGLLFGVLPGLLLGCVSLFPLRLLPTREEYAAVIGSMLVISACSGAWSRVVAERPPIGEHFRLFYAAIGLPCLAALLTIPLQKLNASRRLVQPLRLP